MTAKRKRLLADRLAERDETAEPVVKKVHRTGRGRSDPGPVEVGSARACGGVRARYRLAGRTEQIPLREEGGIEGFLRARSSRTRRTPGTSRRV